MKKITVAGFLIGASGFFVAALFGLRDLGMAIFVSGFYLVVVGMVGSIVSSRFETEVKEFGVGLKVGAVGFFVASLSFIVELFLKNESASLFIFWSGALVMGLGILISIFSISRNKRNREQP